MGFRALFWGLVILVLLIITALPTVMLLGFGLLPAIVALVIDRTEEKSATFCVGGLNFCGVFPYLLDLWFNDNSLDETIRLLTDVFVLAVIYGAAAMGWMLYLSLPPVIASVIEVMSQRRLKQLRDTQSKIVQEWGDEVIMDADLGGSTGPEPQAPSEEARRVAQPA